MKKYNYKLQQALSISSTVIGSLLFCGIIGYFLKIKFANILWLVIFLIIGAVVGLYELYKYVKK
tara:strand:- start:145 stop:336 length:192 start_codon:yes stop_codon:yes gene_type:complete